jgi:hypothetical protein
MQADQVEFGSGMERQVGGVRELGGVAGLGVEVLVGRRIVGAQVPVHLLHAVDTRSEFIGREERIEITPPSRRQMSSCSVV